MILDALLTFTGGTALPGNGPSLAQTITTTANSTNILDLAIGQTNLGGGLPLSAVVAGSNIQPFRDIGIGDDPAMKLLVQCLTTFAAGTSLAVALQAAPDSGTGTPGAFATYYSSAAIAQANLVAGARLLDMDMPRPPPTLPEPRYLQMVFTAVGTFSNALLYAGLVLDRYDQVYNGLINSISGGYPAGITVAN